MGMGTPGKKGGAMAEINVTPLVDVMLVLLIIFMISTPLMVKDNEQRLVDMNLPVTEDNPQTVDVNSSERLILRMDAGLRVTLGEELITDCSAALGQPSQAAFLEAARPCFSEIGQKLGSNPRLAEDEALYLLADTTIPYGFVVGSMNRLRMAGVTNIGMVTNPELQAQQE